MKRHLKFYKKEQNKRLVTKQTEEGPFQIWESIQEFQSSLNGYTATTTNTF